MDWFQEQYYNVLFQITSKRYTTFSFSYLEADLLVTSISACLIRWPLACWLVSASASHIVSIVFGSLSKMCATLNIFVNLVGSLFYFLLEISLKHFKFLTLSMFCTQGFRVHFVFPQIVRTANNPLNREIGTEFQSANMKSLLWVTCITQLCRSDTKVHNDRKRFPFCIRFELLPVQLIYPYWTGSLGKKIHNRFFRQQLELKQSFAWLMQLTN